VRRQLRTRLAPSAQVKPEQAAPRFVAAANPKPAGPSGTVTPPALASASVEAARA
jgi:hypothetical protein